MPEVVVELEPWSERFWRDAEALAIAHFHEVDGGLEPYRQFRLDCRIMQALHDAGSLKIVTARTQDRFLGYYTWNIAPDVESEGLLIAQQGGWYVAPGNPRVAARLFDVAISELKALGVQVVYPHHRTNGRGANIGRFFKRRGAVEIQRTYSLHIGD